MPIYNPVSDADKVDGCDAGVATGDVFKIPAGIAQGDVFYVDASGNIVKLVAGTSGHFLKTQGAGANPIWAAGVGGVTTWLALTDTPGAFDNGKLVKSGAAALSFGMLESDIFKKDGSVVMTGDPDVGAGNTLKTDTIVETTANAGIAIDLLKIKDIALFRTSESSYVDVAGGITNGATFRAYGKNGSLSGGIGLYVPNAAKSALQNAIIITGTTNTPIIEIPHSVKVDTINEYTGAAGVTIDNCLIKDGKAADSDKVDGEHASAIVTNARVKAHFPDTIANILSNHTKAVHDALNIDADTVDGCSAGINTGKVFKIPTGISEGDIFYVNSAGNIVKLDTGTSGYFLKTQGAGNPPIWAVGGGVTTWLALTDTPGSFDNGKLVKSGAAALGFGMLESDIFKKDGSVAMTGNLDLDGNRLTLDTDGDSYFLEIYDDVIGLWLANSKKAEFTSSLINFLLPLKINQIGELSTGVGVTVDNCLIKDGKAADSNKLEASTKAQVRDHTPKAHTLASHSSKAHSELTGIGSSDHHTLYSHPSARQCTTGNWAWASISGKPSTFTPTSHGHDKHTNITRKLFIGAGGYTTGSITVWGIWTAIALDPDTDEYALFDFKIPEDYLSGGTIKIVYVELNTGANNVVWGALLNHAAAGESYASNPSSDYGNTRAIGQVNKIQEITTTLSLTSPAKGEYVTVRIKRDANHASDTYIFDWHLIGIVFEYTANM